MRDSPTKIQTILAVGQRKLHINEFPREEDNPVRWGIAPVSLMADDFATALTVLPPGHHTVTACVAPYRSHAKAFAEKHNVKHVFTNFEDLARCPDVEVVYISPLNPLHCELCHLMLHHDKHVLCEKPLCMSELQVRNLLKKAHSKNLFLMEGMWPRCVPAYHYLRKQIMRNNFGDVHCVHCTLGLPIASSKLALYGGVTNDFGIYGLQLALWVFRAIPAQVTTTGKLNDEQIVVAADIKLSFSGNRQARIVLSGEEKLSNEAIIRGTKGSVKMSNYWCPTRLIDGNTEYEFPLPEVAKPTYYHNRIAMCYEAEEVRRCIMRGQTESQMFNHDESLLVAHLMDVIHEQLGVEREISMETDLDDIYAQASTTGKIVTVDTSGSYGSHIGHLFPKIFGH